MKWKNVSFGDIFEISSSKRVLQKQWTKSGVPFFRAREIVKLASTGSAPADLFVSESHFAELKEKFGVPQAGDLMISAVGTLGACYIVKPTDRFYFKDASVLRFSPKIDVCSEFVRQAFRSNIIIDQVRSGSGSTVGTYTISRARKTQIPLPPLAEQKRIAAILDAADALRAKRQQALAHLDDLLQSTFLTLFGDPVTNPMGWEECAVGEVTQCIVPGRDKPKSFTGSTPWIKTNDLIHLGTTFKSQTHTGLSNEEIAKVRARVIPKGSVIISCVGDLGISSIAGRNMVINQQLHAFQCGEKLKPEFLAFCLPFRKAWMMGRASQTTLPYLNKTNCNSIPIFAPPLPLQQRFAAIVGKIEAQKSRHRAHLAELDTLFASLQSRAFCGEL